MSYKLPACGDVNGITYNKRPNMIVANRHVVTLYCSFIYQRSNQQLVLTVTTPPLGSDPFNHDYTPAQGFEGAAVIVAHRKSCANGNANQLWRFDPITGFIEAMAADTTNKGILCTLISLSFLVVTLLTRAPFSYRLSGRIAVNSLICLAVFQWGRGRKNSGAREHNGKRELFLPRASQNLAISDRSCMM